MPCPESGNEEVFDAVRVRLSRGRADAGNVSEVSAELILVSCTEKLPGPGDAIERPFRRTTPVCGYLFQLDRTERVCMASRSSTSSTRSYLSGVSCTASRVPPTTAAIAEPVRTRTVAGWLWG